MSILRSLLMLMVVVAMAGVGALFALQNEAAVPLDMLVYTFAPRSIALWVLAAFALGGGAGLLMASFLVLRLRTRLRLLRRQLHKAQGEAERLRSKDIVVGD
ncbi:lipopolysaccharide assembly protein LapA domain-containing protein [Pseudohaliea rubra]|uniref:Lipopolysaccharide assembly protein A domain-containing protein n=1 Tax=Pseudohaliea rubra DSM 19751 TaxID=1265313 RepID=A0A095VPK8_9GAMM|nr:lipopolysaccharide assembly protein LapA domain-containing protein [Pseudohaliea rubra]KGE03320.1 hypothetical protein HRUBRA_02070 [Pseudohaliea rubra DSM 19751]